MIGYLGLGVHRNPSLFYTRRLYIYSHHP